MAHSESNLACMVDVHALCLFVHSAEIHPFHWPFPQGTHWHVEDTSTNGTYVNDVRVPKNGSLPLPLGARLRLSNIGLHDPILE